MAKKRDLAERAIIEALIDAGCDIVVQMDWLDLLVGYHERFYVLEVKTGQTKLLPHQQERVDQCRRAKLPCYVVHTPFEALQAIGAIH